MDINDPEYFRILRTLLPFLDFPIQKHFSILLKIMELQKTLEYYQYPPLPQPPMTTEERNEKMLHSIRDVCPPDKRSMFDMMTHVMKMQEMTQQPTPTSSNNDLTSELKKDLTPEQQGMFDMLSNMLGGMTL